MSAAEKLEEARAACARIGVPIDMLNNLAVDIDKASKLLDVSRRTISRAIENGEIITFKIGSLTRIELTELVDFIERNRGAARRAEARPGGTRALRALDG